MGLDDVLHHFPERRRLPVPVSRTGGTSLADLYEDRVRREPFCPASFFEWLLASTTVIETMLLQNTNCGQRGGGQIRQGHGGCHRISFLSF